MKREPKIIDAEFEVVRDPAPPRLPRKKLRFRPIGSLTEGIDPEDPPTRLGFSNFSVPIEWLQWTWPQRAIYLVTYALWLAGMILFTLWLKGWLKTVIPLPDHW